MTDPYGDPDLVALYDLDNPDGENHRYYRALAQERAARHVVDLGCGTGLLTRSLLAPGRSVTGIDPSATMLDWARPQPRAAEVRWVLGDAAAIAPTGELDLVVCTGNALMHLAPDELPTALGHVAAGLRPGGLLAFETRNPAAQAWRGWTREATESVRETTIGRLREWLEPTAVRLDAEGEGLVRFDAHNVLADGSDRVLTSELWFRGEDTIASALVAAGFVPEIDGGWRGQPVSVDAPVLVVRAVRSS